MPSIRPATAGTVSKTPNQVSGLAFWWKADALGLADGAAVSSWADSSGNGHTLTQATGTQQPIFHSAPTGFNGSPAVTFDGVGDVLSAVFSAGLNPAALTVFAVFRSATLAGNQTLLASHDQSTGTTGYSISGLGGGSGAANFAVRGAHGLVSASVAPSGTTISAGVTYIVCGTDDGSTAIGYNDGTIEQTSGTGSYSVNAADPTYVGADPNFGSNNIWFNGSIAEIFGFSAVISAADRASLDLYLANKYGVTVSDTISGGPGSGIIVPSGAVISRASVW